MDPTFAAILEFAPWIIVGIVAMTAVIVFGSIHSTKMKIKNGYPLEGMWGQSLKPEISTEGMERVKLLTQENASLRAELSSMKERLANVEKIVTDSGYQLTSQIDSLRDRDGVN